MSTYAVSDLHGMGRIWEQIKSILKENDTLYFLGDATDRGPNGIRILTEALNDPRVIYIAGNHDIMLANRILMPTSYQAIALHQQNGGESTWEDVQKMDDIDAKTLALKLKRLPTITTYINTQEQLIKMTHSGYLGEDIEDRLWDRRSFSEYSDQIIVHGHTPLYYIEDALKLEKSNEWKALKYSGNKYCIDCASAFSGVAILLNLDTFESIVL